MSIRILRRTSAALALGLAAAAAGSPAAQAQVLQWTAQDNVDVDGRRFGNLALSVPQTDDIAILATCRAQPNSQVEVQIFIDAGNNPPGRAINVLFATDVMSIVGRPGQIGFNEFFGPYGVVMLGRNDDLWGRMRADQQLSISLDGQNYFTASLRGSSAAITRFFAICDAVWGIAPPPVTPPTRPATPTPPPTTTPPATPTPPTPPPTTTPPAASGAPIKPGDIAPPATTPPPVATPPTPGKPTEAAGGATVSGPVNIDDLYLGRWLQVEAGVRCETCTLDINDLGPSLAMAAVAGWSANIIWGADGDTGYATGQGLWTSGALAMQGFTIEVTLVGLTAMDVHLVTTAGQALDFRFVR